jgi:hypothetical protein
MKSWLSTHPIICFDPASVKMQRTTEHDERMTRYLLGDLPETEQIAVEQEYFADPEKFEEVWAAENDIVDRYLRGRLSRGERELFERNYLQSPKHRERVVVARKLLEAADRQVSESGRAVVPAPSRLTEALKALVTPRFLAPATAFMLLLSILSWMMIERSRLNEELAKTQARLSDQQRREREIEGQLAAEREQGAQLKSRLDRLLESIARMPSLAPPSILSFLLKPGGPTRTEGDPQQQISIPRETDLVKLQMKIEKGDSRRFQAAIRAVGGPQVWSQRSLKPEAGAITVTVPANKLPVNDYIVTLSVMTPTGEMEEINQYVFRVIRK